MNKHAYLAILILKFWYDYAKLKYGEKNMMNMIYIEKKKKLIRMNFLQAKEYYFLVKEK